MAVSVGVAVGAAADSSDDKPTEKEKKTVQFKLKFDKDQKNLIEKNGLHLVLDLIW